MDGLPAPARGRHSCRERELARLRVRLQAVVGGAGGIVLLSGEPGIGKTRTARELMREARAAGATVLWGGCFEGEWSPPYGPWAEALGAAARAIDLTRLADTLGPGGPLLARLVPDLQAAVPADATGASLPTTPAPGPALLYDAAVRLLLAVASRAPLSSLVPSSTTPTCSSSE